MVTYGSCEDCNGTVYFNKEEKVWKCIMCGKVKGDIV